MVKQNQSKEKKKKKKVKQTQQITDGSKPQILKKKKPNPIYWNQKPTDDATKH